MWRYKKRWILHYGIDYFKCVISRNMPSLLSTLAEWSNFLFIDNETRIDLLAWFNSDYVFYFIISDVKTKVNLAFIWIWGKNSHRDFFEVTWQGLMLRGWESYFLWLREYLGFEINFFTRIDICLDLPNVTVDYLYQKIIWNEHKKNVSKIFYNKKKGIEETIYFWEKSRKKNNYQLIRIYDKLLDSKKKKKEWLYWEEYKECESVTRLELEIREEKAKFWTVDKLQNQNFIFSVIVKQFYKFNYQFFWFLKFDDFLNYKKLSNSLHYERLKKIEKRYESFLKFWQDFFDDKERKQRLNVWLAYSKRLIGNGFTYEQLIDTIKLSLQEENKKAD